MIKDWGWHPRPRHPPTSLISAQILPTAIDSSSFANPSRCVAARRASPNISYYAFTATPKPKTLELFGRVPNPAEPPSKTNKPVAFHVYSMRQAIEEGYILDVLRNYTSYRVAYQLAQKVRGADAEVDSKKARINSSARLQMQAAVWEKLDVVGPAL